MLETRQQVLGLAGYTVVTANSGAEALERSRANRVDLAVLDYSMPGMNGEELARRLLELAPGLPLIAVSGVPELPSSFLHLVNAHLQKGQEPEALLDAISNALADRKTTGESTPRKTVLCVDDEEPQLRMRQLLFETAGFNVLPADSAAHALEIFRTQHVDAVVMDYWLLGKNGTLVAEEMKKVNPNIPIIMLSGFSPRPGEDSAVDIWLRKASVEPEALVREVSRIISLRAEAVGT